MKGRVTSGGHNIPIPDIRRRYKRGIENFPIYVQAVDEFEVFQADQKPRLICFKNRSLPLQIVEKTLHQKFDLALQQLS